MQEIQFDYFQKWDGRNSTAFTVFRKCCLQNVLNPSPVRQRFIRSDVRPYEPEH